MALHYIHLDDIYINLPADLVVEHEAACAADQTPEYLAIDRVEQMECGGGEVVLTYDKDEKQWSLAFPAGMDIEAILKSGTPTLRQDIKDEMGRD